MLDIINAAGWPIWFLILTSVIAMTLIMERFYSLQRKFVIPLVLKAEWANWYREGQIPTEIMAQLEHGTAFEKLLAEAMKYRHWTRESATMRLEMYSKKISHQLNQYLGGLSAVVTLAPLLGLFGTVVGMIEIFGAQTGVGTNPLQLAHGISVALYNTGLGLMIAIVSLVFYRVLRARVDDYLLELEGLVTRYMDYAYSAPSPDEAN